jgi:putative endonuclease
MSVKNWNSFFTMVNAKELGKHGENLACEMLVGKGYKIVMRNYTFKKAEIDIIAGLDNKLVFVEVKTRFSSYLSDPSLMVTLGKQKQILRAADQFLKEFHPEKEWRFDIVVVIANKEYTSIEHIEDAFYPLV